MVLARLFCTVLLLLSSASSGFADPQGKLDAKIDVDGDTVRFRVSNQGQAGLEYVNALKGYRNFPGFASIQAKDSQGNLLTKSKDSPDGEWTPAILDSQLIAVPSSLDQLDGGEQVEKRASIKDALQSMALVDKTLYGDILSRAKKVKIRFRVFTDSQLKSWVDTETDWLDYPAKPDAASIDR